MKKKLVLLLEKIAPGILLFYKAVNNRRIFRKRFNKFQKEIKQKLFGESEIKVISGPFKGLKYINEVIWGSITPKWLGSYETELNSIIEEIIHEKYPVIIDIGSAEGYYAAGMAFRLPSSTVFAFDTDFISRRQLSRMARLNNLTNNIKIGKYCSFDIINSISGTKTLIISDIEGYERYLLDPKQCDILTKLDILVELHNVEERPDTDELLFSRFSTTHQITEIISTDRAEWIKNFKDESLIAGMDDNLLNAATDESRINKQKWFWMKAKPESI